MQKIIEIALKNAAKIGKIGLALVLQSVLSDLTKKSSASIKDEAVKAIRRAYNAIRERRQQANA